jgi:alkane 1-monooxygenase
MPEQSRASGASVLDRGDAAQSTLGAAAGPPWVDTKRAWWLLSAVVPWLCLLPLWQVAHGASPVALWALPVWIHVALPLLDLALGEDRSNPPESAVAALESQVWYRALVAAYVPGQWAVTIAGAAVAAQVALPWWGWVGLLLTVGGINGIGINAAHELGHKRARWERMLSRLALIPVAYGHFLVEHNRGHHARVATPADPASARYGEGFWAFLPRTLRGSLKSAWELEALRLRHAGHRVVSLRNDNLLGWLGTALLFGALTLWFGWPALPFLLAQAFYGITLLEVVNYIEHYGLLRPKGADGRPVRCTPQHSWNSNHRVSNLFLFHLQRHSDHHAHPARRYQALRHFEESPQLPSGYAAMLVLAYVPPLWRAVMDPRVRAHCEGDLSRANVQPRRARMPS